MSTGVAFALPEERERNSSAIINTTLEEKRIPRVLFFAGDDILATEKHFNPDWKGWGGIFLPHVWGLKMGATKGMLYRCRFTRLKSVMQSEPRNMVAPNDRGNWQSSFTQEKWNPLTRQMEQQTINGFKEHRTSVDDFTGKTSMTGMFDSPHVVYKERFPDDDVRQAMYVNPPNGTAGVVEIVALKGASLDEIQDTQVFFFPEWTEIQLGKATLPDKIIDLEAHINKRLDVIPSEWEGTKQNQYRMIAADMLRSCVEYKMGGESYISGLETVLKEVDRSGKQFSYPEKANTFGRQLNIKRKDDLIAGDSSAVDRLARIMESKETSDTSLRERELALKERELAIREAELGLTSTVSAPFAQTVGSPIVASTTTIATGDSPMTIEMSRFPDGDEVEATTTYRCGRPKKDGEICATFVASEGEACRHHTEG